jgi:hypothetical protein
LFPLRQTGAVEASFSAVSMTSVWPWVVLFGLGAFHGINPAMGWLFAVCLGLQERRRNAVLAAMPPIALGHALSVGLVVLLVVMLRANLEPRVLRYSAAAFLILYGAYRLLRSRHPRWVGMRVGFRDLTLWSFLMASAHGAGLMLIPIFLVTTSSNPHLGMGSQGGTGSHDSHLPVIAGAGALTSAVALHTLGHLLVAALVALLVYEKLGLAILKTAWFNIDFAWALALIATGTVLILM